MLKNIKKSAVKASKKNVTKAFKNNAANATNKESDMYVGVIPFQLLEAKLFFRHNDWFPEKGVCAIIPAYKVRFWEDKDETKTMWFCGGYIPTDGYCKGWTNDEIIRDIKTFIYGGVPEFSKLFDLKSQSEFEDFLVDNDHAIEFLEWRYEGNDYSITLDKDKIYVGLDVWATPEGLKYNVSGSNWLWEKTENNIGFKLDEVAVELMMGETKKTA